MPLLRTLLRVIERQQLLLVAAFSVAFGGLLMVSPPLPKYYADVVLLDERCYDPDNTSGPLVLSDRGCQMVSRTPAFERLESRRHSGTHAVAPEQWA